MKYNFILINEISHGAKHLAYPTTSWAIVVTIQVVLNVFTHAAFSVVTVITLHALKATLTCSA